MARKYQKVKILGLAGILAGISFNSYGDSLIDIYRQALANDPTYKQAEADWLAYQQNLPIARAAFFPNLAIQAGAAYNIPNYTQDAAFATNQNYWATNVTLTATQPIFNWAIWDTYQSADAAVKASTANFYFAQQDLITRTVRAYLNVLQAYDILRYTRASKAAFAQEYDTAKQKYDVGLASITDVYDSQSKYDQTQAKEIANVNQLEVSLENLHQITGHYYTFLEGLPGKGIPLIPPTPNDISVWSETATRQNYQLQAQHFTAEASKANIGVKEAGFFPSLGIQASYSDQRQYDRELTFVPGSPSETLVQQLGTIGIGLSYSIFSGGSVVAETRQARFQYASASAKEETVHRQVVGATRQAFLGVNSYSAQVRADALSIKSAQSALSSARAGYSVGVRTLLDVLDDTTLVYQSQQAYALDQYAYMNNFVALKESAGTLGVDDVARLSSWLSKPIDLEAAKKISNSTTTKEPRQGPTSAPQRAPATTAPESAPQKYTEPKPAVS
jgi:outer membrane protein